MTKNKLLFIVGPTAAGKTEAAVGVAEKIGGEIVSADSMQIYKYMDIGTAKPTEDEKRGIAHHLIDELNPDAAYSSAVFAQMAQERVDLIRAKGKVPIIAGGTGFYANALFRSTEFRGEADDERRAFWLNFAEKNGNAALHDKLREMDAEYAENIHANNVKRVARAIAFFEQTGTRLSAHNAEEKGRTPANDALMVILSVSDRDALYRRINERVDKMFAAGLVAEVEHLLGMGYSRDLTSMQGIGYKETARFICGEQTLEDAIRDIKQHTRNFAKRQLTWFRRQCEGFERFWLNADAFAEKKDIIEVIIENYTGRS